MTSDETDWSLIDFGEPKGEGASAPSYPAPKGTCPKCGKHVGRGLHFHVKSCEGANA